jgi:predicted transcriptional regulator
MNALLISVHGKYCEMYENGTKNIEIRKQKPQKEFNNIVFIYNTNTKKIEFKGFISDVLNITYKDLLKKGLKVSGLTETELRQYAGQKDALTIFSFFHIHKLANPVTLAQMRNAGITPPQNYLYIDTKTLNLN